MKSSRSTHVIQLEVLAGYGPHDLLVHLTDLISQEQVTIQHLHSRLVNLKHTHTYIKLFVILENFKTLQRLATTSCVSRKECTL